MGYQKSYDVKKPEGRNPVPGLKVEMAITRGKNPGDGASQSNCSTGYGIFQAWLDSYLVN